jgi:iron complex outermembrane receptor protein
MGSLSLCADLQVRRAGMVYRRDRLTLSQDVDPVQWLFLNPKLGAVWKPGTRWSVYTSAGYAQREPARSDMLQGYDDIQDWNRDEIGPLTTVKPEQVLDVELGARYRKTDTYVWANAYAMRFRNEIIPVGQFTQFGLQMRKNVPNSLRAGAELEYGLRMFGNLWLTGFLTYQKSRIFEYRDDALGVTYRNTPHLLSPEWMSQTALAYRSANWEVELNTRFVSESFLANDGDRNLRVPQYWLLGARASWRWRFLSLGLMLDNLTDRLYYTAGKVTAGRPAYFVQAPRNVFFTLKLNFK